MKELKQEIDHFINSDPRHYWGPLQVHMCFDDVWYTIPLYALEDCDIPKISEWFKLHGSLTCRPQYIIQLKAMIRDSAIWSYISAFKRYDVLVCN